MLEISAAHYAKSKQRNSEYGHSTVFDGKGKLAKTSEGMDSCPAGEMKSARVGAWNMELSTLHEAPLETVELSSRALYKATKTWARESAPKVTLAH